MLCHPDAVLPSKSTEFAAGFDLYTVESVHLEPGLAHLFRTGIQAAVPPGYCAVLFDRSGMGGKRNIHRLAGVIDQDYRGEWLVSLINLSDGGQDISRGDKIVQALILPVPVVKVVEVSELPGTERGEAGFGSTGS
jgi:dUTP pyrophosphatase